MRIINQIKRYIDDYFYNIVSQVIEMHYSDYDSHMDETQKNSSEKRNTKENKRFSFRGGGGVNIQRNISCKFQNEHGSNLAH